MTEGPQGNRRALFRVRVVGSAIRADIGPQVACELYDASPDGFATFTSAGVFEVGAMVEVTLRYQGCRYQGVAEVCSYVNAGPAAHRYGLRALGRALKAGLRAVAVNEERMRLRRRAERG